ncbi:uncharacterized protein LOC131613933 [Vicia villosa]|uniref:uncharacterized protein LOC131613933 n=1 Tax=Vicia villosa TaxID=3911 RepID=UPI00273C6508|nr:uncharacterized protein LOC131613933 [Vicia villosa]
MGFGERWMRWMDSCIFTNMMSIHINGSTTKEFIVEKGLRKGDPLSPFLFILVMEVLTALLKKSKELGEFCGFKIKGDKEVDLLQFADDTIIIAEGNTANLWSMKSILRGFELMSGSRINFHKSIFYGFNVGEWYLEAASSFLSCKVGSLPFKFLGVRVGDNPRKLSMWKDLIMMLRGKDFSCGEAPKKVLNEIRSFQSKFLWSGGDLKKSINWVCWDTVSKTREGSLGVKSARDGGKWRWNFELLFGAGSAAPVSTVGAGSAGDIVAVGHPFSASMQSMAAIL